MPGCSIQQEQTAVADGNRLFLPFVIFFPNYDAVWMLSPACLPFLFIQAGFL